MFSALFRIVEEDEPLPLAEPNIWSAKLEISMKELAAVIRNTTPLVLFACLHAAFYESQLRIREWREVVAGREVEALKYHGGCSPCCCSSSSGWLNSRGAVPSNENISGRGDCAARDGREGRH